jgi:hypothetical protein
MAELRQRGRTQYYCRRCNRPLAHDTRHKDTVSVNPVEVPLRFVHDCCGGEVLLARRPPK